MKQLLLLLCAAMMLAPALNAAPTKKKAPMARVDIRYWNYYPVRLQDAKGDKGLKVGYLPPGKKYGESMAITATTKQALSDQWETHEITFVPEASTEVELLFSGVPCSDKQVIWTLYDKVEAEGAKIFNGSFEELSGGMVSQWENHPSQVRQNFPGVPDGKNCAAAGYKMYLKQIVTVVKGKPVTIRFRCRAGETAERPQIAPLYNPPDHPADHYRYSDGKVKYLPLKDKGIPGDKVRQEYPWIKPTTPPAVIMDRPQNAKPGKLGKVTIPFELKEESGIGRAAFVRFGVPFPQGGIYNTDGLRVCAPDGTAVPAQFTVSGYWPDRSVKFVLTEFEAPLKANEVSNWTLRTGESAPAPAPKAQLLVRESPEGLAVTTGRLQASVSKEKFRFLNQVRVDRKPMGSFDFPGLELIDEQGKSYKSSDQPLKQLFVESAGPLRATIRGEGEFQDGMGRFTVRMSFFANSPKMHLLITYQNIRLVSEFTDFRSLSFRYRPEKQAGFIEMDGIQAKRFHQQTDTILAVDGKTSGTGKMLKDGGRSGNLTFALRDLGKRYPKAVALGKETLDFELLPALVGPEFGKDMPFYLQFPFCEGCYRMKWGMGFTEEITFDFSGAAAPEELAALSVIPVLDRQWVRDSGVFNGIPAKGDTAFADLDAKALHAFHAFLQTKAKQREYGFLNWGDWFGERGRNWTNSEYDLAHGLFMLSLRTGNREAFRHAQLVARHVADVDICHAYPDPANVGGNLQHGIGHTGQHSQYHDKATWTYLYDNSCKGGNGHTWSEGLTEAWLLGGDPIPMESALLLGEHLTNYFVPTFIRLGTHERSAGWSLPALLGLYRATGDPKYLNSANRLVRIMMAEHKPHLGGAWAHLLPKDHGHGVPGAFGNCCFMMGIVLEALHKYDLIAPSPELEKVIASGADWMKRAFSPENVGWPYGAGIDGKGYGPRPGQSLNLMLVPGMMAGGVISGDKEIYEDAKKVVAMATFTGLSPVGKNLSFSLCMLPELYQEMERFAKAHPEVAPYRYTPENLAAMLEPGMNAELQVRGPKSKKFLVSAKKTADITVSRRNAGKQPKTPKPFTVFVKDAAGKAIFQSSGTSGNPAEWQVKLPSSGDYTVEIEEDLTGYWGVRGGDCFVRFDLSNGAQFFDYGVSRQLLAIPAGAREFKVRFFGTHPGGTIGFLMDPSGNLAGQAVTRTEGAPRLPGYKHTTPPPWEEIAVKLDRPAAKESDWKFITSSTEGDVRMEVAGAKAALTLAPEK